MRGRLLFGLGRACGYYSKFLIDLLGIGVNDDAISVLFGAFLRYGKR